MHVLSYSVLGMYLLSFRALFTAPSFITFVHLAFGAILNTRHQTICNMIRVLPESAAKHFTCYHRFFSRSHWSILAAGRVLSQLILKVLPADQPVRLVVDDTTTRRKGSKVYARGSYRDAVRSSRKHIAYCNGHKWLVISVLVALPGVKRPWAMPVLVFLVLPKEHPKRRKPIALLITGLRLLTRWHPGRQFILTGDYAFGAHYMAHFAQRHPHLTLVSRFRLDAALYAPPPPRKQGRGRPRVKGERLPTPGEAAAQPDATWLERDIPWYNGQTVRAHLLTGTAYWYHVGQGLVHVHWVIVRRDKGKDECFYTTDAAMTPEQIVVHYVRRWAIEVTFEEIRRHLHLEKTEVWSKRAVQRLVPCLFALFTLTVLWFKEQDQNDKRMLVQQTPWYRKTEPTYANVIAQLREQQIKKMIFSQSIQKQGLSKKIIRLISPIIRLASQAA